MAKVNRFEDLIAWQKARELARQVYNLSDGGKFAKDFALRDQVRRSAVSIMSNIAEGFDRGSRADFHRFLVIAKAPCAELRAHLYISFDIGHLDEHTFAKLMSNVEELGKVLNGLRAAVERQRAQNSVLSP